MLSSNKYSETIKTEEKHLFGPSLVHALTWERALRGVTIASVACGPHHCLALSTAPHFDVYSWGCSDYGRLGHGDLAAPTSYFSSSSSTSTIEDAPFVAHPRLIAGLTPYRVVSIACGVAHSACVTMGPIGLHEVERKEEELLKTQFPLPRPRRAFS